MSELIDVMFYMFLLLMPFFSGLYFEKGFIISSIFLFLIFIFMIINNIKNKIKIKVNKKLIMFITLLFISTNLTYIINYYFLNETIVIKNIFCGNMQLVEMILFAAICILKVKGKNLDKDRNKDKDKDNKDIKIEYRMQDLTFILSSTIMSMLMFLKTFYRNGRFEGTFYYANALAIFLLLSLVVLYNFKIDDKKNRKIKIKKLIILKILTMALITISLVLTNSRYTYILLLLYVCLEIIKSIFNKENKKNNKKENKKENKNSKLKIATFSLIGIITFICFITINMNTSVFRDRFKVDIIKRDIDLRISYLDEANSIIKDYPFGLGYEGYLNHQDIKENKYRLRLVHNMPYQIVLNYGFITLVIVLIYFALYIKRCINNKTISDYTNLMLLLLILHSLMDIGTSFLAIDNVVIMYVARNILTCDDNDSKRERERERKRENLKENLGQFIN